ncbi:MAG: hypothetical protein H0W84_03195, partial [Bacteroidetes bacterium]|nr:hypothetical protein [Bacteroidota bacterium]
MKLVQEIKNYLKNNWLKTIILVFISLSALIRVSTKLKPDAPGDALEYVMMTEALRNHLSVDIDTADFASFKKSYIKKNSWESNDRYYGFDRVCEFAKGPRVFLDDKDGFFVAKNGKIYTYHFFFYSLLNVPARIIADIFSLNPLGIFQFVNALLIIISCFIFYRTSKFNQFITGSFCLLFYYSTNYWYIGWPHPEIFTICFTTLGLWFFFNDKYYAGIGLITLAALQNQPLVILLAALCLITLYKKGINLKNIIKIAAIVVWILIPSLFFYYHFSITNLVQYKGFLDTSGINSRRFLGFFFDLNQGMILAFPLILLIYLLLVVLKTIKLKSTENKWDLFLVPVIIIMTCIACTMTNWNHGQAVVNRYVTYISAVMLIHFFFLLVQTSGKAIINSFLVLALISQLFTIYYFQTFNSSDRSDVAKPIANWVLDNYPEFYNPDPSIFISRYMGTVPHPE